MSNSTLSREQIRNLRRVGHALKPVVMLGNAGLTSNIIAEIKRALTDHELIKIKVIGDDREERQEIIAKIVSETGSELAHSVGKMALLYKKNPEANPNLSNISRYY